MELHDIAAGDLPPGDIPRCGNRLDRPKRERVHKYQELGPDLRNGGARGFIEGTVSACSECGADKFKRFTD